MGDEQDDKAIRMVSFSHELLSQYVGTSRPLVTYHMNEFRRQGYLRHSLDGMVLYPDALREWLRQSS
jgi:CRP-like cAMP-binding protein